MVADEDAREGQGDQEVPDQRLVTRSFELAPGEAIELDLALRGEQPLELWFESSGAIEWDVCAGAAGALQSLQRGVGSQAELQVIPPEPGSYAIEWRNSSPVTVEVTASMRLPGDGELIGWERRRL